MTTKKSEEVAAMITEQKMREIAGELGLEFEIYIVPLAEVWAEAAYKIQTIVVTAGLLEFPSTDRHQTAFVIAHEAIHIAQRHDLHGHSDQQNEYEADKCAADLMVEVEKGFDPVLGVEYLRRGIMSEEQILAYALANDGEAPTHPPAEERIRRIKEKYGSARRLSA